MTKVTLSVIKADVGSLAGHTVVPPELKEIAKESLSEAKSSGLIVDFHVANCGDDLELIMGHYKGEDSKEIHALAWSTFEKAADKAKAMKLYGAGQDLLADAFSGNVRGMGPGISEMEFTQRKADPLVVFMMDKTEPGAFNLPIYKIFADPFTNAGLVIDPNAHAGFRFEVWDIMEHKKVIMSCPEETYDLLALIGAKSRYVIKRVWPKEEHPKLPADEPVAVVSTEKLFQIAGEYVGKDDPCGIVRAQSGLPSTGEVLEGFAFPHLVSGWMRGSHNGPLMPCAEEDAICSRFDGPPRVVGLGFNLSEGVLHGPLDMFKDPVWDYQRQEASRIADYMRRHGPFEPHRLPLAEMEYTTLPKVLKSLGDRFQPVE